MGPNLNPDCIHVVIGIIKNTKNEVLVARRKDDVHLGGLLEFPGGKVEVNEESILALSRELQEELDINLIACSKLIQFPYHYPDRIVFLEVYMIDKYSGKATANESQDLAWQSISSLNINDFPNANHGIVRALQLPKIIAITPEYSQSPDKFLSSFEKTLQDSDVSFIHLRSHELSDEKYLELAKECLSLCDNNDAKLILNRDQKSLETIGAAGHHLTSKSLLKAKKRTLSLEYLLSASCHTSEEIIQANNIGADYIFLGPVIEKHSGKNSNPLGWNKFSSFARESKIPIYAIGGLTKNDIETSIESGGQGIAAIRSLWQVSLSKGAAS